MEAYLVGGFVRDTLLGLKPQDKDYVVLNETPESMINHGFRDVSGNSSAMVYKHSGLNGDFALARKEVSTGKGHKDFTFEQTDDLTEDLLRRDFTINAIACPSELPVTPNNIIDPFNGHEDLVSGFIQHVNSESFMEDPLRVIRAARLAARFNFSITRDTKALCRTMVNNGMLRYLPKERIYGELKKALMQSREPSLFFFWLKELGALKEIFPWIAEMQGCEQNSKYHPEGDVYNHSMLALNMSASLNCNLKTRIAALFHDIGKTLGCEERRIHTDSEAIELMKSISETIGMEKDTRSLCLFSVKYHMHFNLFSKMRPKKFLKLFKESRLINNPGLFLDFLKVCLCDKLGRGEFGANPEAMETYNKWVCLAHQFHGYRFSGSKYNTSKEPLSKIALRNRVTQKQVESISSWLKKTEALYQH